MTPSNIRELAIKFAVALVDNHVDWEAAECLHCKGPRVLSIGSDLAGEFATKHDLSCIVIKAEKFLQEEGKGK